MNRVPIDNRTPEHQLKDFSMRIRTAIASMLLLLAGSAFASSTYYVRTDGGPPSSCNGMMNVTLAGAVNKGCAWSHPFFVFPPNIDGSDTANKALMKGGDTLIIGQGEYQMGEPFGTGVWDSCKTSNPWDCHMQPIPSGTAAAPTKIMGANYAACVNGANAPKLSGSGGAGSVINLTGSSFVLVECLEISDRSSCIKGHPDKTVQCQDGGAWASNGIIDTDGRASNFTSANVTLQDINIHGMAKFGVLAGNLRDWSVSHMKIVANGYGGWSTDLDPAASISSGTNKFTDVEIAFNGCTENYPASTIWGCWGQQIGGYGDGFGTSNSSDQGSWLFQDVSVHDNAQDGLDFLHANPSANITMDRVSAANNAGNQLKANGTVTIQNSIVNARCSALQGKGSMAGNNSQGGKTSGDNCRAGGDAVVLSLAASTTATLQNSTIISEGNCIITVADISGTDLSTGDQTSKLVIANNILIGMPVWVAGPNPPQSCLYYWHASNTGQYKANLSMTSNVYWHTNGAAPAGNINVDPQLVNETLAAFDPTPTAATPPNVGAIRAGTNPPPICPAQCIPKIVYTLNSQGELTVGAACK